MTSPHERFQPYHSGSRKTFLGQPAKNNDHLALEVARAAAKPLFEVKFITQAYAPNHIITIRNKQDGWTKEAFGSYQDGSWRFYFEIESYSDPFEFKFVLNNSIFMSGPELEILNKSSASYTEDIVRFNTVEPRFAHGYDNFHIEQTKLSQDSVPGNTREDIKYDVIIVGSGMGGGILADALSDNGVKTLVLEAGGVMLPTHMHNLPGRWSKYETNIYDQTLPEFHQVMNYQNVDGSGLLRGVHLNLGGRSNYWSGIIPRMQEWELEFWPDAISDYLRNSGFAKAEKLLRKGNTLGPFQESLVESLSLSDDLKDWTIEDLPVSRHQPNLSSSRNLGNVLQSSTGTFSTADLLINSLSFYGPGGRDNLTVNLGHLVTYLQVEGNMVSGVVCQDLAGNRQRLYSAKVVVLAAGSLESAKIVLNSDLVDPSGKVGVGITDHPAFFSRSYIIPSDNPISGSSNHAKIMFSKKGLGLEENPFGIQLTVNPEYWNLRNSDDEVIIQPEYSRVEMAFPFYSKLDDFNTVISNGVSRKLSVRVQPNQTGSLHRDSVRNARNHILRVLDIPHDEDEGMHYGNEGTVHHAGGSLRMSDDHTGVVDTGLKFERYDNLYCVDPSVWPFIPAANPTLMIAALALRLADTIQERL